ncbi:14832_t:CDS:2 [Acaulospora morrowiae]|uniref:14832_t:CDS:1 n=1 Tax=Acaulospora morrowiae TaxID=94023 RepID=A0A9N8VT00_9GLOM|nr:14832_t:CDS:2 [Acaulospora morrowiae]
MALCDLSNPSKSLRKHGNVSNSNEDMRSSYIEAILHTALRLIRKTTSYDLSLSHKSKSSAKILDWAIKELKELLCITEGKQPLI